MPLVERSKRILSAIIGDEISAEQLANMVAKAFTFRGTATAEDHIYALELLYRARPWHLRISADALWLKH